MILFIHITILTKTILLSISVFWDLFFTTAIIVAIAIAVYLVMHYRKKHKLLLLRIKQLEEANIAKDKFFSIISHDLKGPFNGIIGMSNILIEEIDETDKPEIKEIITDVNVSAKNAYNLLNNLLNWSQTQTGVITNKPIELTPQFIVDYALETVYNLARKKEITIERNIEPDQTCYADENMIATILRNLLTNAIKFSPRNSRIVIQAKSFKNKVVFSVQDFGIGFKSDEIDLLFRKDVHFQKKGTEQEPGTGLGLKLCNELAHLCHAKLWVISEPNNGSTFYLSVPQK